MEKIKNNIEKIRSKLPYEVILVGVTKNRSIAEIEAVIKSGVMDLGENRVQEFKEKYEHLPKGIKWHLIGHLQKNKVKYVVGKVFLIHSVDSVDLAKALDRESNKKQVVTDILIQINVSKEESKYGLDPEDLPEALKEISTLENIRVKGLMTIAPNTENIDVLKDIFATTRAIYDKIKENVKEYANVEMTYLSMGMTNDFELAVEAGSNMVRIGSGLFE
ncbi:MAG TPA: YggS family pyridoxal phosphate-dependent enzyme [Eubacteriaceae bacterium]|jgi:pyridoxal phosphate enzyme (YggS family)|nr:YggS family pyridoxal phosphate-dependent enzyme [Eubacteriaceae bacterium]